MHETLGVRSPARHEHGAGRADFRSLHGKFGRLFAAVPLSCPERFITKTVLRCTLKIPTESNHATRAPRA